MIILNAFLKEGYALAGEFGIPVPDESERSRITETTLGRLRGKQKAAQLAAACEAYYVFRRLHSKREKGVEAATLLGDYFFSAFSRLMLPFQNDRLLDSFSQQLKQNCTDSVKDGKELDIEEYLPFVEAVCELVGS